jgi:tetratricopeptide (TPR) repeat protein
MGSFRAVAATVLAVLFAPELVSPALAQPTAGEVQARELVNKAKERSTAGDHHAAIDLYLQAYNIAPLPLLLSNVAAEYEKLNDSVQALKYFCKYLDAEPDGPMAGYARSHAKEEQGKLHNTVDDQTVCKPLPTTSPPETGSAAPPAPPDTSTTGTSGGTTAETKPAQSPDTVTVSNDESNPGSTARLAGLITAGVGVAGLTVGIIYGVKAENASNEITNWPKHTAWPNNILQLQADGRNDEDIQIAGLVAGGVLVVGGAVIYYLGHQKGASANEHASVRPVVAPGYGGIAFTGGW